MESLTTARLRTRRGVVEVTVVLGIYILFWAVAAYSGQTTMSVDIINPPDGMGFRSSPVDLIARTTVRGVPVSDATARFTIHWTRGEVNVDTPIDKDGFARLLLPASSGNYTWHITAIKEGYPKIVSQWSSFSIELTLTVDAISPNPRILAVSPVDFKAKVTDAKGRPVESANVTFYVDSANVGSSLTGRNGIAKLSSQILSGSHMWFASTSKDGEGGISDPILFIVGELASHATGSLVFASSRQICGDDVEGTMDQNNPLPTHACASARRSRWGPFN